MSETVNLPALGESVTEGTVTRWLVEVGDTVEVDQPLLEVSTDKVDTEVPSPAAGTIEELLVAEDETIEVGAPLVRIGDGSGGDDSGSSEDSADSEESAEPEQSDDESGTSTEEAEDAATEAAQPEATEQAAEENTSDEGSSESSDESSQGGESGGGETQEITLPALGESVTEGTVTRWLVEVGDTVEVDQPLLEVSTDKVDTEVPSPVAGTIQEIKVSEDETIEVGAVLALVGSGSGSGSSGSSESADSEQESDAEAEQAPEPATEESAPEQSEPEQSEPERSEPEQSEPEREPAPQERTKQEAPAQSEQKSESKRETKSESSDSSAEGYVTPLVRRLAKNEGVDLADVKGTGVGGRIRKQDVVDAAEASKSQSRSEAPAEAPAAAKSAPKVEVDKTKRGSTEKAPRIRQVIAQRMNESLDISAQLTQVHEIDMTRIVNLRAKAKASFKEQNGVNLTYLPFIGTAVTEALKQHPKLNAEYDEANQQITYHDSEHLALAVDTEKGLLVPVINDAGDLSIAGLSKKIADVAERTRQSKIGPGELSGGTFTITNFGSVGALFDTPIINQPQVAILGTGTIVKRPMVVTDGDGNESIGIRHMMYLSLTYDHRLVDGADAGRFMQTLKARLEEGNFEAQLGL
ncbi:2-oxoglutarate dehydrogenase, E2 component, dihydrolipoamide succinyltransferase [Nesterenkonia sp. E16_7]|uniref:2-oxoglutarate dehydrogenase, E2 component, dihydrolipoamide succinyltransferase n=1 Tax=unclassified Nesterenkonia TaxID=2629769 RepID=UPI001A92AC3D|nr:MULTISPECIES: 2-oxoglutarate dehydrogenase, E2 component, dihydrolipoamide succinyltransferase [unclassified Nesterenkonia]MBO0595971.1 2-oxoglutarate dehydrogenase, E2 component, dihydrolipoamide succinyltransferase [Nesterenkonia sp. E16_10]MBO0599429.1 2-oxoglutarate dehydrogenase, E2 component, dihydrolipoamide succinyltransferase [Nesterenkonia sp. E16_7]